MRAKSSELVERFSAVRRAEHGLVILCFVLLACTGFAQKFHQAPWAAELIRLLGGVDGTRRVHHLAGLVAVSHLLIHSAVIVAGILRSRMKLSLLPVPQDFRDLIAAWRYRLGWSHVPPKFGLFSYQQKFQYLGLLLGGAVVMLSGLVLLFPRIAVLVLPGHVIPAAREAHSSDALLAYLLLVAWHLYATVFSPDASPINKSIFTGYLTRDELRNRHGRHYDEIFGPS